MKRNDFNHQGFTLIEILLSVMIVAVLAGSLYATFAAGIKLERRAKLSFQDIDEDRVIMEQLYKDFSSAVFYDFHGSFPDRKSFVVDGTKMIFLVEDGGELKWVRYMLSTDAASQVKKTELGMRTSKNVTVTNIVSSEARVMALVRDENDFVHYFTDTDQPQQREILTARVPGQGWQIFCAASIDTSSVEWSGGWNEDFLPAAVRLNVSIKSGNGATTKFGRDFILPAGGNHET